MKQTIPFSLERWKQGNCRVVTEDGKEVTELTLFSCADSAGYRFAGVIDGAMTRWMLSGHFWHSRLACKDNLLLEIEEEQPARKTYALPLTEIQALEITRDMWKWLSEDIKRSKSQWVKQFHPELAMPSNCACCAYAFNTAKSDCKSCPLKHHWGSQSSACTKAGQDFYSWETGNNVQDRLAAAKRISEAAAKRLCELAAERLVKDFPAPEKKQPTLRPWKPEEVPPLAMVRVKGSKEWGIIVGLTKNSDTSHSILGSNNFWGGFLHALNEWEHSLDRGKTWLPCGVME